VLGAEELDRAVVILDSEGAQAGVPTLLSTGAAVFPALEDAVATLLLDDCCDGQASRFGGRFGHARSVAAKDLVSYA
jgi:hypothetical protein